MSTSAATAAGDSQRGPRRIEYSAKDALTLSFMLILRLACIGYWIYTTLLLLVPEPRALVGLADSGIATPERGVHFTNFALLTILTFVSRWPLAWRWQLLVLVGYALATESLQWFVPHRTVELLDYLENLLGIVCAASAIWLWCKIARSRERAA